MTTPAQDTLPPPQRGALPSGAPGLAAFGLVVMFMLITVTSSAQILPVTSGVYHANSQRVKKRNADSRLKLLDGKTRDLEYLHIEVTTQYRRLTHTSQVHDLEELIIVKGGRLMVEANGEKRTVGPGSVLLILPGVQHSLENAGSDRVTYYSFQYLSRKTPDVLRGDSTGASMIIDWDEVTFHPHDKGGIRNFIDRPTTMCERLEIHMTTLNAGLTSHDPHRHRAAEMVLMIEGDAQMVIGETKSKISDGDLVYLASEVLHGISNTGSAPCRYYAIQFQ